MSNLARAVVASFGATLVIGGGLANGQEPIPCGPVKEKHKIVEHKNQHPSPVVAPGMALVYVIRKPGARWRMFPQSKVALNGRWVAVVKRGQYTFFETEPGLLKLCLAGGGGKRTLDSYLLLTAQAGQTYYLRVETGHIDREAVLFEIDEAEARNLIKQSKYVTWEVKK